MWISPALLPRSHKLPGAWARLGLLVLGLCASAAPQPRLTVVLDSLPLLLAHPGLDTSIVDNNGDSALTLAMKYGRTPILGLLLAHLSLDPEDEKHMIEVAAENEPLLEDYDWLCLTGKIGRLHW